MFSATTMIVELLVPGVIATAGLTWTITAISNHSILTPVGDCPTSTRILHRRQLEFTIAVPPT